MILEPLRSYLEEKGYVASVSHEGRDESGPVGAVDCVHVYHTTDADLQWQRLIADIVVDGQYFSVNVYGTSAFADG